MPTQVRHWCFTLHLDASTVTTETTTCPVAMPTDTTYSICQLEKAPTTGAIHLQGYFSFPRSKTLASIKKIPGFETAHLEPAKGSPEQNKAYCSKSESRLAGPWELGQISGGQGARSDLTSVKRLLDDGATDLEIAESHFGDYLRYGKAFATYRNLRSEPRGLTPTPLHVVLGATGLGKTTWVLREHPKVYTKPLGKWWSLFTGTDPVLFDDFHGGIEFRELLRLANPGRYSVEIKGAEVNFNPDAIWITSNITPDCWYSAKVGDPAPLLRRITTIYFFMGYKEYISYTTDPGYPESPDSKNAWSKFIISENYHTLYGAKASFLNE